MTTLSEFICQTTAEGEQKSKGASPVQPPLSTETAEPAGIGRRLPPMPVDRQWAEVPDALKRLHDMTLNALTAADLGGALEVILEAAIDFAGADLGNIQLYDRGKRQLRIVAQRGFEPAFTKAFEVVDADDDTACGRALRERKTCCIQDVHTDRDYAPYRDIAASAGYRAVQSTPLICRNDDLVGVLSVHFRMPRSFSYGDTLVSELIAQQAADIVSSRRQRDDLAKLNEALRQRNSELAARDRNKTAFLVTLGHELRNPLAAIHSSLPLVTVSDERTERALNVLRRQSAQLLHLVNDLLDLGRITHGKLELKRKVLDLREPIREAADANRRRIEAKGLRLELHLPEEPVYVYGDGTRLIQVLDNLLDNAVRFTDHGHITITARKEADQAFASVRDTGAGMEGDKGHKLFEPFYQVKRDDHDVGSLGFGLALVKSIVEMHGGSVRALSDGPGSGSAFVFTVPLSRSLPQSMSKASVPELRSRRVLVVDDNRDNAEAFGALLETLGQDVRVAYDGGAALEIARRQRPEVAFLDLSMPKMDGRELAHRLRERFPSGDLTLVALTGLARANEAAQNDPFEHYLLKPAAIEDITAVLASLNEQGVSALQNRCGGGTHKAAH